MQPEIKNNYEIIIPNEKAATYKVVTFIIALINLLVFLYLYFNETNQAKRIVASLGAVLSLVAFVFYCIKLRTKYLGSYKIEIAFIFLAIDWFFYRNFSLGLMMLLFATLGFYANRKTVIRFAREGIRYPSFPPKTLSWGAVDFALLKDGILTIEMKDNRLYQFSLSNEESAKFNEAEFNHFCNEQLRSDAHTHN